MYVIFPLDELLDLNSARGNKRGRATLDKQSHTRHTAEVLPLSQPNQQLPNQLKPPLNQQQQQPQQHQKQPQQPPQPIPRKQSTTPKLPQPPQQQQIQQQPQQQQQQQQHKQPPPKTNLTKAPSKTSILVSPPSVVVTPESPSSVSVPISNSVSNVIKKPPTQQTAQSPHLPPPSTDQVTKRQRSSHSTSTETSSTSSTGAKGKSLLSPQSSGGAATNRSSWGGSASGPFQESSPARSGSFKTCKDITVASDGISLKVVDQSQAGSTQDVRGSTLSLKPPLNKSNSFRSHLSETYIPRPRQLGLEAIKKPLLNSSLPPTPKQPSPSCDILRKAQESAAEQSHPPPPHPPEAKASEVVASKQETALLTSKERQPTTAVEGIKIKQEVPVQAAPPVPQQQLHHQQLTAAESLRIQQECLSPASEARALLSNQRHPSGRSSGKLSDLPPSGIGGGSRGASAPTAAGGSSGASSKTQGVLGSPRGLQQRNMASHEASFRDLTNPTANESLKAHNAFTFKLVKTGPSSSGPLEESQSPDETLDHRS